ncbi:hypothetical protein V6N11_059017 [Hibiscus sabdariffa]|uniref:RNase H type-1 domain-containing protein n=1 Tax=Hibiscus sabdariffa TaxID=183260 RepID=A0ABR2U6L7_9ROSI
MVFGNPLEQPLLVGWFRGNSDARCGLGDRSSLCEGVIHDHEGNWMCGVAKYIGICWVLEAELWGWIPTIVLHVRELANRGWIIQYCHVPCVKNRLAHSLAKLTGEIDLATIYFPQPPSSVASLEQDVGIG